MSDKIINYCRAWISNSQIMQLATSVNPIPDSVQVAISDVDLEAVDFELESPEPLRAKDIRGLLKVKYVKGAAIVSLPGAGGSST